MCVCGGGGDRIDGCVNTLCVCVCVCEWGGGGEGRIDA